jgi:hypothetical protein
LGGVDFRRRVIAVFPSADHPKRGGVEGRADRRGFELELQVGDANFEVVGKRGKRAFFEGEDQHFDLRGVIAAHGGELSHKPRALVRVGAQVS